MSTHPHPDPTSKSEAGVTYDERMIMMHTLGLDQSDVAYRNYFYADAGHADMPVLMSLVSKGYMVRQTSALAPDLIFRVTKEGKSVLKGPPMTTEPASFGHHPEPEIDYCIEVDALIGPMIDPARLREAIRLLSSVKSDDVLYVQDVMALSDLLTAARLLTSPEMSAMMGAAKAWSWADDHTMSPRDYNEVQSRVLSKADALGRALTKAAKP